MVVAGELDLLTAPLLEHRVCEQLTAKPAHLILDLESLRYVDAGGLRCLLRARALAQESPGSQLHLFGLATRQVAQALRTTGLLGLFSAYPTLIHAVVSALAERPESGPADTAAPAPVLAALWCCSVGTTW